MAKNPKKVTEDQEIDLTVVSKKIGKGLDRFSTMIFKSLLFLKRNIILIAVIVIVGFGIGFYLDQESKIYDHEIIVSPNFESVDYLYDKIDLINAKIQEGDTLFLRKTVGIKTPKSIKKIQIEPLIDVYKFIEEKKENFELLRLMAESGDMKKILEENVTSKNYKNHKITFVTALVTNNESTVEPILKYLNENSYFSIIQSATLKNINNKIQENDVIIAQINNLLNGFSKSIARKQNNPKLVFYNESTQLNDMLKTKEQIIYDQAFQKLLLIRYDKIIKESSSAINVKNTKSLTGKKKFILPLLFLIVFILLGFLKSFYNNQMSKITN